MNKEDILNNTHREFLSNDEATRLFNEQPGYLPIHIISAASAKGSPKVLWMDFANHHFSEAKFTYAIKNQISDCPSTRLIETDIGLLEQDQFLSGAMNPNGFIFFVHRCGSTLLGKALAQPKSHVVMAEADALHEGLWAYLTDNWRKDIAITQENMAIVRHVILALGKKRTPAHNAYFVKFNPWHSTKCIDIIRAAFPDVPSLFLYRDVGEMLASVVEVSAPIMSNIKGNNFSSFLTDLPSEQLNTMGYMDYFGRMYRQFFIGALNTPSENMVFLNYKDMTAANLDHILKRGFGYTATPADLQLMQQQFGFYSKDDTNSIKFQCDKQHKQTLIDGDIIAAIEKNDLQIYYDKLEASPLKLFR